MILMGGVGGSGGEELRIPYTWMMHNQITLRGQWMYSREPFRAWSRWSARA